MRFTLEGARDGDLVGGVEGDTDGPDGGQILVTQCTVVFEDLLIQNYSWYSNRFWNHKKLLNAKTKNDLYTNIVSYESTR